MTSHVRLEDSCFGGHLKDLFWEHNVLFSKGFFFNLNSNLNRKLHDLRKVTETKAE